MQLPDETDATLTSPEMWKFVIEPPPTDLKTAVATYKLKCQHTKWLGFEYQYVIDEADLKDFQGNLERHANYFHMYILQTLEMKFEEMKGRARTKFEQAAHHLALQKMKAEFPDVFKEFQSRN
jgi:hypothetical protein